MGRPRRGASTGTVAQRVPSDRGVSETTGVAVLVVITVVITTSVGVGVLLFDQNDQVEASFSFSYIDSASQLLITYDEGDDLAAGNLVVSGPDNNVTWAALADSDANATLEAGDAVQVTDTNAYGSSVGSRDEFRIVYRGEDGGGTVLGEWDGA